MPNRYQSKKDRLGDLLQTPLTVPDFQRTYSWDKPLIEVLWQDIRDFSDKYPNETFQQEEYFLGSIVLVDVGTAEPRIILDGQQRLATATILLAIIRDRFQSIGIPEAASDIQVRLIGRFDAYTQSHNKNLSLNQFDKAFFARDIQEPSYGPGYAPIEPSLLSHRRIRTAANYFREQIGRALGSLASDEARRRYLARLSKIVSEHLSLVVVWSDDEDEAATVFETLNDRGIGLSASDLVRNLVLSRAQPGDRTEINQNWGEVLGIEPDAVAEDFLRHFWLSREGDVKTRSLYREIKAKLVQDEIPSVVISRELRDEAGVYSDIVAAEDDDPEMKRLLVGLDILGAKVLLPPLLSAYSVGNLDEKRRFLANLLTLYVRHVVVGGLEGSKLETFLYDLARRLRSTADFTAATADMREFAMSDPNFQTAFATVSVSKASAARYLLREIERSRRPEGDEVQISGVARVNLEHVYPQNPTVGRWPDHEDWVYRIGNLTLLAKRMNTSLRNQPFAEKRSQYSASDLLITKELGGLVEWDSASITERQNRMTTLAANIWKFV